MKLQITPSGARSWILRATIANKVRDIGLGGYPDTSLKTAREAARDMRTEILRGIDPVEEKRRRKDQAALERASRKTFDECAEACISGLQSEWRNQKSEKQWRSSFKAYVSPIIGNLPVSDIQTTHILTILEPIWTTTPETASRVRGRIEKVLAYATTRGYRKGDNPALYKGHLDTILPQISKLKGTKHQPALDYREIGNFIGDLRPVSGSAAKALEFAILTGTRSGEVRGATWTEIDLNAMQWIIPAERMKAKKQHIVPLSKQATNLLKALPKSASNHVFPGRKGGSMSDMSLTKVVQKIHELNLNRGGTGYIDKYVDNRRVTPHGFRSTFRDWAGEQSPFPREVIEHALAHQLKDKAEAAYQRKTSIPKRIELMQAWADYCDKNIMETSKTIFAIKVR